MESWYDFNSRVAISCAGKSRSARPEKNAEFGKLGPHFSKFGKKMYFVLTIRQKKPQKCTKNTKLTKNDQNHQKCADVYWLRRIRD